MHNWRELCPTNVQLNHKRDKNKLNIGKQTFKREQEDKYPRANPDFPILKGNVLSAMNK